MDLTLKIVIVDESPVRSGDHQGISLTHWESARRLQYITGHGADGALPSDIDWRSLADSGVTTIVYMPKKTLGELAARAIAAGLDPATPALAIAQATRPDETVLAGSIADLLARLDAEKLSGPVLVKIGSVAAEYQMRRATATLRHRA